MAFFLKGAAGTWEKVSIFLNQFDLDILVVSPLIIPAPKKLMLTLIQQSHDLIFFSVTQQLHAMLSHISKWCSNSFSKPEVGQGGQVLALKCES